MSRRPSLPLWTGKSLSTADYRAAAEKAMSERAIQRALLADLANPALTDGPVLAFHVPNGIPMPGIPAPIKARIWKAFEADGALAGAADLVVCHRGRVLFLELKSALGVLSGDQEDFRDACGRTGVAWASARSVSEARQVLKDFGALRR